MTLSKTERILAIIAFKLVKEKLDNDSTFENGIAKDVIVKVLEGMKE